MTIRFTTSLSVGALALLCSLAPATSAVYAQDAVPFDAIGDDGTRTAIRTIIADAAARGLPTAPLVTKVREGIAKKAAPDRIRTATSALAGRLAVAADALAPTRSNEELAAAADALQAGIPVSTLRDMRKLWPGKPLTVPLGVLAEMVQSGVSKQVATQRVRDLLVKGATAGQFASLGTNVRDDIASGLAPDAAMELRSKSVLSVLNSQQGLFNGLTPAAPTNIRPRNK
ncbi:MAG: hypothetical protein IBJ03_08010 [Gemmatimonadaceae bacterium]|nr:hypothetical protein [Gemmatimonadaceae bacterium]